MIRAISRPAPCPDIERGVAALVLIATLIAAPAFAIGNRTHAEISERAADRWCSGPQAMVPGLADFMAVPENRKALYSGSTFPDWGFGGIEHEAAEQSHWTPFLDLFATVLKEKLQSPWTAEDAKNVAFFLGDISHSAADIPWHFDDPLNKGFLSAAHSANGCSHIDCDTGSDSFLMRREDVNPPIGFGDYYWPTELLHEVYLRAGRRLPKELIKTGGVRQQGYWIIAKQVSDVKIGDYSTRCPWIGEHLDGYYYGGIDHNAAAVSIWFKHYFARLRGDFFYQNAPVYGRGGTEWVGYTGCTDTTVFATMPNSNAGGEPLLELHPRGVSVALMRFDMPDLPLDLAQHKATLWLATEHALTEAPSLEIAPLPALWKEGETVSDPVSGAHGLAASDDAASWTNCDVTGLSWQRAAVALPAPGWLTLDIAALAAAWAATPGQNHGVALRLHGGLESTPIRVFSSEAWKSQTGPIGGERVAQRPALVIETAK